MWGKGDHVQTIHPGAGVIAGREQVRARPVQMIITNFVKRDQGQSRAGGGCSAACFTLCKVQLFPQLQWHYRKHSAPSSNAAIKVEETNANNFETHNQVIESWRAILRGVRPRAFRIKIEDVRVWAGDASGYVTCTEVVEADESQGR